MEKYKGLYLCTIVLVTDEIPILEHMSKMKLKGQKEQSDEPREPHRKVRTKYLIIDFQFIQNIYEEFSAGFRKDLACVFQPMAPFILTRDRLQAQVIGAGYPSLPTYTLEEFYEQKYKDTQPAVNRSVLNVSRHYEIVYCVSFVGMSMMFFPIL